MTRYPLFWMRSNNLGDALNPVLYKAVTGREPEWSEASPKIVALGSTVHEAGPGDVVWGAGCISADAPLRADAATKVCMVRGPLTEVQLKLRGVDVPNLFYGDPALLLPFYFSFSKRKEREIGFIPHYSDASIPMSLPSDAVTIDVMNPDPLDTVQQIIECECVASSSLHGLIVAETYGTPAVWIRLSDNIDGCKFRDHHFGTGRGTIQPLDWRDGPDWAEFRRAVERWSPPVFDAHAMLDACPFDWGVSDYKRWKSVEALNWDSRLDIIASMIPPGSGVVDFGAGREALRNKLPEDCAYVPLDLVRRNGETVVADLNAGKLPPLPPYDVAVFAGVLEYVHDVSALVGQLTGSAVVASYATAERNGNRSANGWVNDYTAADLARIFGEAGFICRETREWLTQTVCKFVREEHGCAS